ncbi:MAG: hypothetical protein NC429_17155 [Lachnospiraceae bacterium]|nr:hypothetical protein [Lachnospiraceae bacterium]
MDADGKVYFCAPIWGNDFTGDVDGSILLFLAYNAETKEFDVCDILYSEDQQETQQDKRHVYDRLYFLALESSIDDRTDCWAGNENGKMKEDPSGKAWTFEFDDKLDVDIYNVDISLKVELLGELWARYTVYEDEEEADSFEAFLSSEPPDLKALYIDITDDGSRDVVIIGSTDSGGFEGTPWAYAYDLKNHERISLFGSDAASDTPNHSGCLTEKQTEQMKEIVEKDGRFKELFPGGRIDYDGRGSLGGIPMVDALGNVYFQIPVWGSDFTADVDGSALLFLVYNADTKKFDVCDILYQAYN